MTISNSPSLATTENNGLDLKKVRSTYSSTEFSYIETEQWGDGFLYLLSFKAEMYKMYTPIVYVERPDGSRVKFQATRTRRFSGNLTIYWKSECGKMYIKPHLKKVRKSRKK